MRFLAAWPRPEGGPAVPVRGWITRQMRAAALPQSMSNPGRAAYASANSADSNSACANTVLVASSCKSGG